MYFLAFSFGLIGSLHCLLMCGPLMVSIKAKKYQEFSSALFYQSGRLLTYLLLGVASFAFGLSVEYFVGQRYFSLFIGVAIVSLYWLFKIGNRTRGFGSTDVFRFLRKPFARLINNSSLGNSFFLGTLNGLLPCGLVYLALATASISTTIYDASLFMSLFGAGTLPMTLFIQLGGRKILPILRGGYQPILPYFIHIVALLLIIRGMGFGIPYLSPLIATNTPGAITVCGQ